MLLDALVDETDGVILFIDFEETATAQRYDGLSVFGKVHRVPVENAWLDMKSDSQLGNRQRPSRRSDELENSLAVPAIGNSLESPIEYLGEILGWVF